MRKRSSPLGVTMKRAVVFSIAGSDPSGGAGIQQDLKVFTVLKVYGCAAITALTVQDTTGVKDVFPAPPEIVRQQVMAVMDDIQPMVVKIGMLATKENVEAVADVIDHNRGAFIVADPVILSKNSQYLLEEAAIPVYIDRLFPLIDLLTPNIPECVRLTGISPDEPEFSGKACMKLCAMMEKKRTAGGMPAVLLKGGHGSSVSICTDCLYADSRLRFYEYQRLSNPHTHGTGCTLSSAIAAFIGKGESIIKAVEKGRAFVFEAIKGGRELGKGTGPVDPLVFLK